LLRDVLPVGTSLKGGDYRIDYALGRGGFGITYRAAHVLLERIVAIKEYYPQEYALRNTETGWLIAVKDREDVYRRGLRRFVREGRILCSLRHSNVVQVLDLFEEHGTAYLVMELIQGCSLAQEMARFSDKLPEARIEKLISQLVEALSAIHAAGVYHLDLKPDNVMIMPGDRIVLVDFGAARQGYTTTTDSTAFTLEYAAPEVMWGSDVGPESDLFSLGMMLHELLTGKRPPLALVRLRSGEDNWQPKVAEPWKTLLEEALHLNKENRPSSVRDWWRLRVSVAARAPGSPERTLSVKCPKCQRRFSVSGAGTYQCPSCQWKFDVDAYGKATIEKSLLVVCPNCRSEIIAEAGPITCPNCNWQFIVNQSGKVVEGIPIRTECPWCGHHFLVNKIGAQQCPGCGQEFEIDRGGVVIAGKPIMTQCPNCSHDFPVTGAGEWKCPACRWTFTVNRHGVVISGKPIEITCPICTHLFRVQQAGRQCCPACHAELQISHTGAVIGIDNAHESAT
jgi:serine/threonine protein kinase